MPSPWSRRNLPIPEGYDVEDIEPGAVSSADYDVKSIVYAVLIVDTPGGYRVVVEGRSTTGAKTAVLLDDEDVAAIVNALHVIGSGMFNDA